MFRRVIAGLFLGPALLIGSFSWAGFLALRTVFDSSRSATIAQELFDNEEVRSQLADNVAAAVEAALPDEVSIDRLQVAAAAEKILADPQVESLVIGAFSSTHAAFLGEGDAPRTLDLTPVAAMVRDQLVSAAPALAAMIPADQPLIVTLPTDQIPDASPVSDFLRKAVPIMAAVSLAGLLTALLATSDRPSVLKRAAGWAIGTTAVYLIIGLGIPELLRRFAPDQAKVIAALLTALLRSTLVPSVILAVVGVALFVAAFVWPDGPSRAKTVATAVAAPTAPVVPRQQVPMPGPPAQTWQAVPPPVQQPAPTLKSPPVQQPAPTLKPPPSNPPLAPESEPPDVIEPAAQPPAVLPTRATASESVDLPAWTGEPAPIKWLPPKWVDGHGWVLDPDDPRPPPVNAKWVEGIGHVVPGPPP